ncbi:MAG: hypothetical protein J6Y89_07760 [Lachnospiraceae bacterium]|nr:hypothetical protein [Lachnospiraceae bacterium]
MAYQELLPEHIPNGQNIDKSKLGAVNSQISKLPKKAAAIYIGTLVVIAGLSAVFALAVGGALGYVLAALMWILYPALTAVMTRISYGGVKKSLREVGLSDDDLNAALRNRKEDKRAWGEPFTMPVKHRFICRKCKKQSDWFSTPFSSCTRDTMIKKLEDFKYRTDVKKKFYENKRGLARYSLERKCPSCGKMQKKKQPGFVLFGIVAACFALPPIIEYLVVLAEYHEDLKSPRMAADPDFAQKIYEHNIQQFFGGFWEFVIAFVIVAVVWVTIILIRRKKYAKRKPEYSYDPEWLEKTGD